MARPGADGADGVEDGAMNFSDFMRSDNKEVVMMDVMDKARRDQLRTLALAATPGEWAVNSDDDLDIGDDRVYIGDVENAAYIAAANPATLLALLDRIDELEGDAEPDYWGAVTEDGHIELGMREPTTDDDGAKWCARTEVNQHINDRMLEHPGLRLHLEPLYRRPPTERAVPGWIPVSERLPDENEMVLVFVPGEDGGTDFDFIEEGTWANHESNYQHFEAVGGYKLGGEDCRVTGPSEEAPYTHWMPLPAAPGAGGGE